MTVDVIPPLDRTSPTFPAEVDTYFADRIPLFTSQINTLSTDLTTKQGIASAAAVAAENAADLAVPAAATAVAAAATAVAIAPVKSATPPVSPAPNAEWIHADTLRRYTWLEDESAWVETFAAVVADNTTAYGELSVEVDAAEIRIDDVESAAAASSEAGLVFRPAFIEQFITGHFGRGMLTSETINVVTEQALVGTYDAGQTTLVLTNAANITVGGSVTVKHDNGLYENYFVDSKSSNNIGIRPALLYPCTAAASRIERTWFNRAHPGKFYMRHLAQRIARASELDVAMPKGRRILCCNFSTSPQSIEDTLTAVGGAAVSYFAASNLGETGTVASPARFAMNKSAFVDTISVANAGAETAIFDTDGATNVLVKVQMLASSATTSFAITVLDELGIERGKFSVPAGASQRVMRTYTFPADLRGATGVKVRIASLSYVAPGGYLTIGSIDLFDAPTMAGKLISNAAAKIVCLGDSWISGDLGSTAEREPLTQQLAVELPYATVINAGVGGNKLDAELARFDTDVTPHRPDYVIVNTGTNEAYSPFSGTFEPNAIDSFVLLYRQLINKIVAIGARPIIIGVPALAQSDADVPGFAEWLLNDRAKEYSRRVFEQNSKRPIVWHGTGANGTWTKFANGTMIARHSISVTTTAANTVATAAWTYPIAFITTPTITTSPATFNTNQVLATGHNGASTTGASIRMVSSISAITIPVDCVAVGRWR